MKTHQLLDLILDAFSKTLNKEIIVVMPDDPAVRYVVSGAIINTNGEIEIKVAQANL